ncbi:MAG: hypothetical protein QXS54_03305 [Candidatus Methanomethylicaceae archaeon]
MFGMHGVRALFCRLAEVLRMSLAESLAVGIMNGDRCESGEREPSTFGDASAP